jgi:uncharacterized protein (DUF433 family)
MIISWVVRHWHIHDPGIQQEPPWFIVTTVGVYLLAITLHYGLYPVDQLAYHGNRYMALTPICYNALTMKEEQRLYHERIVTDPRILAGKPVVKGTRIAVDLVLEELSHNPDIHELLAAHPDLTRDDVQACLAYAQAIVTGKEVSPKPPKGARSDAAL